jgi:hypothetical protein
MTVLDIATIAGFSTSSEVSLTIYDSEGIEVDSNTVVASNMVWSVPASAQSFQSPELSVRNVASAQLTSPSVCL